MRIAKASPIFLCGCPALGGQERGSTVTQQARPSTLQGARGTVGTLRTCSFESPFLRKLSKMFGFYFKVSKGEKARPLVAFPQWRQRRAARAPARFLLWADRVYAPPMTSCVICFLPAGNSTIFVNRRGSRTKYLEKHQDGLGIQGSIFRKY